MSNETKYDVFKDVVETLNVMDGAPDDYCKELIDHYDAALPDNLPVLPKKVGKILQSEYRKTNLLGALNTANGYKFSEISAWIIVYQNTFASAWVLGAWRVQETGEIVKLEVK